MSAPLWLFLTFLLHPSTCESKGAPIETHSKLEVHAKQLEEELPNKKVKAQVEEAAKHSPPPEEHAAAPATTQSHKHSGPTHIQADKVQGLQHAVGDMMDATDAEPKAVTEVMSALKNAQQGHSGSDHESTPSVPQGSDSALSFQPPPGNASAVLAKEIPNPHRVTNEHALRADKFKKKMRGHVDDLHDALHEHTKNLERREWMDKQTLVNAEKEKERELERERENALRREHENKLKLAAEQAMREKRAAEQEKLIENRTAQEAAYRNSRRLKPSPEQTERAPQRSGATSYGLAAALALLGVRAAA